MKIVVLPVTPFEQNCSILICDKTQKAAIVDPGGDLNKIIDKISELKVSPEKIFITHGHLDHCGGTSQLKDLLKIPVEGPHIEDQFWIDQLSSQGEQFGFPKISPFVPNKWLQDGNTVSFGETTLNVIHCPGHTPGHIVLYNAEQKIAIVGDVIFKGSIGRTDFPRGNHQDLINSITQKLWPLGDDVLFLPGHGPTSTFGEEKLSNPFVSNQALSAK